MDPLQITKEQLRSVVLEALPSANNLVALYSVVAGFAAKRFVENPPTTNPNAIGPRHTATGFMHGEVNLHNVDKTRVIEIVWNLIAEGIIHPGADAANDWPRYRITEHGQQVLKDLASSPFDPDGYLSRVSVFSPRVDDVIITYLTESLRTFRIGCYLASTVTLGCASEKAVLLLIDATADALPSPMGDNFRKKVEPLMMRRKFEEFHKMLIGRVRGQLPKELDDLLDVQLNGIFDIIRNHRNAAGHPSGTVITQADAHANLYVFPTFLQKVYAVIGWLQTNKLN